jgi:hypothetical protein
MYSNARAHWVKTHQWSAFFGRIYLHVKREPGLTDVMGRFSSLLCSTDSCGGGVGGGGGAI